MTARVTSAMFLGRRLWAISPSLVFDAWNRLVSYTVNGIGGSTTAYQYDALNRRIVENPGVQRVLYYSSSWQVLEEDVAGTMQDQYVWSPVYVDAMIERDRTTERLYVQQDANWNVTAVISTTGAVLERYIYDPYGTPTVLDPNWNTRASSLFAWNYLHQGGRYDGLLALYLFETREYSGNLGRWIQIGPLGFDAGDADLYRYVSNNPVTKTDPSGLRTPVLPPPRFEYSVQVGKSTELDRWGKTLAVLSATGSGSGRHGETTTTVQAWGGGRWTNVAAGKTMGNITVWAIGFAAGKWTFALDVLARVSEMGNSSVSATWFSGSNQQIISAFKSGTASTQINVTANSVGCNVWILLAKFEVKMRVVGIPIAQGGPGSASAHGSIDILKWW
jgi:RHS repeat-associated protein